MENTQEIGAEALVESAPEAIEQPQVTEQKAEPEKSGEKNYEKILQREQRRINRLTAAKYEALSRNKILEERLAKLEAAQSEKADARPSMDQFNSYDEYNEALTDWKVEQKLKGLNPEKPAESVSKVPPQETEWYSQRTVEVTNQAQQLAQHIPDFSEVIQENASFFDAIDNNYGLEKAFLQSQHPVLAAYVLAKEGKLEELLEMTPQQAAYEIGRATHVGVSGIQKHAAKQTTKAPAPMASAKGTASGAKTPDNMTGHELLKWIRSN